MGIEPLSILAIRNIVVAFAHLQEQLVRRIKPSTHGISIFNRSFSTH